MKNSKKLKLVLMILICILVILIGYVGIYSKASNSYKNILPEYKLASDLKGSTVLEFEVDESTETIYLDKDGKEVDSTNITEENEKDYKTEKRLVNEKENLNIKNYNEVIKIMKKRLEFLQANQYRIDLDKKTGKIVLTFEDEYPDDIKSFLQMEGKFELVDSNTNDVILDYTNFTSADTTYAAVEDSYMVYINLKLNNSGVEKLNNIDSYKTSTTKNEDSKEETETVNKFKVMFDGDEIKEISYDDMLVTGKTLRITTAKDLKTDSTINSELNTNTIITKLATMGKLPVVYNLTAEEYVQSNARDYLGYVVIGIVAICIAISIYFIIRYKSKGILAVISFIANISLFLLIIRLTNIQISLNGFAGIIGLIVLNTILVNNILKFVKEKDKTFSENIKSAYMKTLDVFIVTLIIFAVFAFSSMTVINSMGLLVFWGWVVAIFGNLILTVPMLSAVCKK